MSTDKLPTLSYEIAGSILTLRASGTPTLKERKPVYDAVRADAAVPNGASLLLDIREIDTAMYSDHAVVERLRVWREKPDRIWLGFATIFSPPLIKKAGSGGRPGGGGFWGFFFGGGLSRH